MKGIMFDDRISLPLGRLDSFQQAIARPDRSSRVQHIVCPCNTISDFPQRCPYHSPAGPRTHEATTTTTVQLRPVQPDSGLSDRDVERIAQRLAEILREVKP